ncbi:hypothetical protein BDV24DRAFT_156729 [Aspergillus arachidicola]|uniref:Uncharacterized protein n=1 Tax=Aspergillus arachidicola TaxID=656916 RepID=A0A5N6XNU6_9EURO|nr:hypothetical protein BDV24DRAFT_156729 [Aspergillus arachidicola]
MIRIICGLDLDVELMRAYLTDQQRAQIKDYPELEEACCKFSNARTQYKETEKPGLLPRIQRLKKKVKNTRVWLLRALRYKISQLSGTTVEEEEEDRSPLEDNIHPFQLQLVQCLNRRDAGADAVTQYCSVFEEGPQRGRPKRKASDSAASNSPSSQPHKVRRTQNNIYRDGAPNSTRDKRIRATRKHIQESKQPRHCYQYFADKKQPDNIRFRRFHNSGCVTRHFDSIHLNKGSLKFAVASQIRHIQENPNCGRKEHIFINIASH